MAMVWGPRICCCHCLIRCSGDCVEKWLNDLLCLDCSTPPVTRGAPHPSTCELYYVNRDTLFSHHKVQYQLLGVVVGALPN